MTLPVVLTIVGSVGILIFLIIGGIKIERLGTRQVYTLARIVAGILGVGLLGIAVWISLKTPSSLPSSPVGSETNQSEVDSSTQPPVIDSISTQPLPDVALSSTETVSETPIPSLLQLTDSIGDNIQPSFSPDGKKIVFISKRDGNAEVYLLTLGNPEPVRLTNTPDIIEDVPSFSPDGSTIICGGEGSQGSDLYLINLDGSQIKNITNTPKINEGRAKLIRNNYASFSVLFDSDQSGNWEIYTAILGLNGLEAITKITNRPDYIDRGPTYLSGSNQIMFRSEKQTSQIYVMDMDGKNIRQISNTPPGKKDYYAIPSMDGKWILFTSNRDGNGEIYVMNMDGTIFRNITQNPADDTSMSMSPDNKMIVFSSNRGGGAYQLYQIPFNP